jgi:hypothetical protein
VEDESNLSELSDFAEPHKPLMQQGDTEQKDSTNKEVKVQSVGNPKKASSASELTNISEQIMGNGVYRKPSPKLEPQTIFEDIMLDELHYAEKVRIQREIRRRKHVRHWA